MGNILEAIIANNPARVADNLARLGINVSGPPTQASVSQAIARMSPPKGRELEVLSTVLDIHPDRNGLAYELIMEEYIRQVPLREIVKKNYKNHFRNDKEDSTRADMANDAIRKIAKLSFIILAFVMILFYISRNISNNGE